MATEDEIRALTHSLRVIDERIPRCEAVGKAIVAVGEPLVSTQVFGRSDYERLRADMIDTCDSAIRVTRGLRRDFPDADLIFAHNGLTHIRETCRACLERNVQRVRQGQPFECALQAPDDPFRFRLDGDGNIRET